MFTDGDEAYVDASFSDYGEVDKILTLADWSGSLAVSP